jgi:hypothetical protein
MSLDEVARKGNLKPKVTYLLKIFFKNMNLSWIERIITKEMSTPLCPYLAFVISSRLLVSVP